ncbi:hypothetical protein KGF54_000349 [Candida jiufengensis]|uniref:uncharacterized protein n=1 Tax=Candida jiufengensis TaxID=497108 RepID=UPI002224AC56|nr:uncharacterized protein KGF54_000349 [Candida jiufengensis]KAI5956732.1 hypothetical protein KGF54_000349 [Candida jiufengensis]
MISDSEESSIDNNDYTIDDYYKLVKPLFVHKNIKINASTLNDHKLLRTIVDFNLSHSLLLKNQQKRELELGDLISTKINYVDSLITRIKPNPTHHKITPTSTSSSSAPTVQYSGCFRNKYIEFCPHFALSAYLFSRFHIPDEYGAFEFSLGVNLNTSDAIKKLSLLDLKLLKGNNKLVPISYSQQHKSSIAALNISSYNYKDVNLTKLLTAQGFDITEKLLSPSINKLPSQILLQLAGFESFQEYDITRNSIEPPAELLNQIFSFINEEELNEEEMRVDQTNTEGKEDVEQVKNLFAMLRRSLCQDMIIIKKRYPANPLSKSEIFNSVQFLNFANEVENSGKIETLIRDTCFNPNDDETESDYDENWPSISSSTDSETRQKISEVIEFQNLKLKALENQLLQNTQQQTKNQELIYDFIKSQTNIFQKHSENLQKIQNSINGLFILMSSKNPNSLTLAKQNLQETQNFISNEESKNIQSGIVNTLDLLNQLNQQQQLQQQQQHYQQSIHLQRKPSQPLSQPPVTQLNQSRQQSDSLHSQISSQRYSQSSSQPKSQSVSQPQPVSAQPHVIPSFGSQQYYQQPQQQPHHTQHQPVTFAHPQQPQTQPTQVISHVLQQHSFPATSSSTSTSSPYFATASPQVHQVPQPHSHPNYTLIQQQKPPPPPTTSSSLPHLHQQHLHHHPHQPYQPNLPRSNSLSPISKPPMQQQPQQEKKIKTKRDLTLEKRLSRQATTLYEMWDDFKNLEDELKSQDISITEWLKVHGSSERQFRHTRLKIIKFIEEESIRRNCNVEIIKEKLHNKMRNRLRPWTLDEVQRMLTSGKRIDLDDSR